MGTLVRGGARVGKCGGAAHAAAGHTAPSVCAKPADSPAADATRAIHVIHPTSKPTKLPNAAVAWATFELPVEGPRYRAGINFQDANAAVITRLLETITTSNHS